VLIENEVSSGVGNVFRNRVQLDLHRFMGCNWLSALTVLADKKTENGNGKTKLFVTHYTLAPGAPLRTPVEGYDDLVVGMNDGELANETKLPQTHVNVTTGSVVLMPKEARCNDPAH
jgi:hypothetical protein